MRDKARALGCFDNKNYAAKIPDFFIPVIIGMVFLLTCCRCGSVARAVIEKCRR